MDVRRPLSEEPRAKIGALLKADDKVGEPGANDRNFIEAVALS